MQRNSMRQRSRPPAWIFRTRGLEAVRRWPIACCTLLITAGSFLPVATAELNSAMGGINGFNNGTLQGGDGTGTAQIEINSVQLALVKEARDITGAVLAPNADVAPGQELYFVLYVDNITDFLAYRFTISDAIDETQFTYVANSLETTTVASGSDAAARWAGIWSPLTDALGGPDDIASILDTGGPPDPDLLTIGDVPGQANLFLSVPAQTQWAIRFRVRVN